MIFNSVCSITLKEGCSELSASLYLHLLHRVLPWCGFLYVVVMVFSAGPWLSPLFARLSYWFFVSKYVEYLDTVFLIVAQKPVSSLQYWHHMGAPLGTRIFFQLT